DLEGDGVGKAEAVVEVHHEVPVGAVERDSGVPDEMDGSGIAVGGDDGEAVGLRAVEVEDAVDGDAVADLGADEVEGGVEIRPVDVDEILVHRRKADGDGGLVLEAGDGEAEAPLIEEVDAVVVAA